ncbi:unnamed protein product, partial [Ectocarpus sp. 6 AP-2014]
KSQPLDLSVIPSCTRPIHDITRAPWRCPSICVRRHSNAGGGCSVAWRRRNRVARRPARPFFLRKRAQNQTQSRTRVYAVS